MYNVSSHSEFLETKFELIDEYQATLNQTAENDPSNITFSNKTYLLDGKPQNPNITQPEEMLEEINVKTELYEAAKVDRRRSCGNLEDQIVESVQNCKTGYVVINNDVFSTSARAFAQHAPGPGFNSFVS